MIIAGESSGELYGALLAKDLRTRYPQVRISGVGGERMESAGVEFIGRIASSFGITEALKTYGAIRETFRKIIDAFSSFRPQVLVVIDYPDFNIRVAREAKKRGIKVLYYVSPQVWAWRKKRVNVISRVVDAMAVILPFETPLYGQTGIHCEFVGHPVLDEIREILGNAGFGINDIGSERLKTFMKRELKLLPDKPVMVLMPGSRRHEIKRLLPVMTEVIGTAKRLFPDYQFVIPVAPNLDLHDFDLQQIVKDPVVTWIKGQSIKALMAGETAVIASGTSTLQAALLGVPMTVIYKLSPLSYYIGKLVVKVKHISLVNILLDASVKDDSGLRIKELLQQDANRENIVKEIARIVGNADYRNEMKEQLERVRRLFLEKHASQRVSEIAASLVAKESS